MLDVLYTVIDCAGTGFNALQSMGMTIAILVTGAILAAAGGMVSARMRLYGAIVGGMILNIAVKAEGGSYATALAAMLLATVLAFAVGSAPFLVQLLRRVRPGHR